VPYTSWMWLTMWQASPSANPSPEPSQSNLPSGAPTLLSPQADCSQHVPAPRRTIAASPAKSTAGGGHEPEGSTMDQELSEIKGLLAAFLRSPETTRASGAQLGNGTVAESD